MMALACSYVWWHALKEEVEKRSKACSTCLAVKSAPVKAPLHLWEWSLDFFGPFMGKTLCWLLWNHTPNGDEYHVSCQRQLQC